MIGGPHLPGRYRVQGRTDLKPKPDQYRTDFEADLCINFIRKNREQPFFLMLSPYAVHIPLAAMLARILSGMDVPGDSALWWSVVFGANLGGNLTPIGSASTLVAVTIIHKHNLSL